MKYLDDAKTLESAVTQAVGAASMCWDNVDGAGVFNSTQAKEIASELVQWIIGQQPWLGFATTQQLIVELHARVEVSATIGESWPSYSTMGGRDTTT